MSSAGPCQYGHVEDPDVALDDGVELAGALARSSGASGRCTAGRAGARTCRRPRSCPAPRSGPSVGTPVGVEPGLGQELLAAPVRLAGPERDRPAVG